jgi:hypothetical protein
MDDVLQNPFNPFLVGTYLVTYGAVFGYLGYLIYRLYQLGRKP